MPDAWNELAGALDLPLHRLTVAGRQGFLFEPHSPAPGRPWVLYAPSFEGSYPGQRLAWIFGRVLRAGIAVTGVDIGESYGSPQGRALVDAWHACMTRERGHAWRVVLLPQSRGGPMVYTWAAEHPEKVAGVTGIYTVCDLRSHPGLERTAEAWGVTRERLESCIAEHNPVDRLAPLVSAGVPVWHIHGDNDTVVPLPENAGELVKRYAALGGAAGLLVVPGRGHEEHACFFERDEVVQSIIAQAAR